MNENYLLTYIDFDGNVNIRKKIDKIKTTIFAGCKFLFDRLFALIGLILLSPLILLISVAIKIDSRGPVFFVQERTGKGGKTFKLIKFRSMVKSNNVHDFKKKDQHTKVGKFLRKTSLDEIPQLIPILFGKMSFIGPRPWIVDYYNNMTDTQRYRYCVRPGLTGLAQVNGRNAIKIIDKIKYDLKYVENYSLKQDIKIMFLTIKAVFTGKGADAGKSGIKKDIKILKKYNGKGKSNGK